MKQPYLREYAFEIKTLSPIFIGSGQKVGKKEYVFNRRQNTVTFLNMWKFFKGLNERRLLPAYQDYMLKDYSDLFQFLKNNGIRTEEYMEWAERTVSVADADLTKKNTKEILTFVKDPYGFPYIPGSSLKGALRNIFQTKYYLEHPEQANRRSEEIRRARIINRKYYLEDVNRHMSQDVFHVNCLKDTSPEDPVNDMMRGVIVSDSSPLSKDSLEIYQKVDLSIAGEERSLPLLRECLCPGTTVSFTITVDSNICDFKGQDFVDAVTVFYKNYKKEFMNCFPYAPKIGGNATTFFLGGGAGYVSKTTTYALMHGSDAQKQVGKLLDNTLPRKGNTRKQHDHLRDAERGASPHLLKCTVDASGNLIQMGACHISSIRKINKEEMNS